MEMFRNIGTTLKLLRELRGRSQAELARKAAVGKSQLSKYENGKELPKLDSLQKLLGELGVTPLGFFHALHTIDLQEQMLSDGGTPASVLGQALLPYGGVLSKDADEAFRKIVGDLLEIYSQLQTDLLFRVARPVPPAETFPEDL